MQQNTTKHNKTQQNTIKKHRAEEEEPPAVLNAHVFNIFHKKKKLIPFLSFLKSSSSKNT